MNPLNTYIAKEEMERFKKPFPNKEKVYKIEKDLVGTEDKLLLQKLLKKNTGEKQDKKALIVEIKNKMKSHQVRFFK